MNNSGQNHRSRRSASGNNTSVGNQLAGSILFQLGGGLLVAIVLPVMLRFQALLANPQLNNNTIHSVIGAALALSAGFFVLRRFSKFPGMAARPYILVIYTITFGITIAVFFMLRLEYNRYLFLSSFVMCLIWFLAIHFTMRRIVKIRLAVIPGGNAEELLKIPNIVWTRLSSPQMYEPGHGAMVADLRSDLSSEWVKFIADSTLQGIAVFHSKQAQEMLTGKVDIEHLSENSFGSLLPEMDYLRFKQATDIVVTILLLPVLLIVMGVTGLMILMTCGGPVFFKQERIGYRGASFFVYKFRTMRVSDNNGNDGETRKRKDAMTENDDVRITRVGRILRKYRIDELPQVINILKGEMGWIGPRPEALTLSRWYQEKLPFYSYRHVVRPGITGWAQVNQGHVIKTDQVLEKLHYDFFYIKNMSVWLDLLIVLRTIRVIFLGIGAK